MWSYNPVSEEEINKIYQDAQEERLWPEGIYNFDVLDHKFYISEPKDGKKGNPVIKLVLRVFNKEGKSREIWDWLVSTERMQFKIKHFCDTTRLDKKYQDRTFKPEDVIGKSGRLILGFGKNDKGEKVNRIIDYDKNIDPFNDEIPF